MSWVDFLDTSVMCKKGLTYELARLGYFPHVMFLIFYSRLLFKASIDFSSVTVFPTLNPLISPFYLTELFQDVRVGGGGCGWVGGRGGR